MNKNLSANEAMYTPQFYKTFLCALESFFHEECPQLGGLEQDKYLSEI